ncbi:serine hydrolase domain-containing protein [Terrarubrum flagellatum]|uniref:serine hydrolase domain-containing protein n=1 Tax=Terrirubrum flagellatum TaxID=2895980 RepID=UPI003145624C
MRKFLRACGLAAIILACGLTAGAFAQAKARPRAAAAEPPALPDSADAYRIAADQWIERYKPATLALLVKRGGRIVYARNEKKSVDEPTLLGSLSKMITGVCVATLVRDGKLDFDAPMREALSGFFARNGAPADPRFLDVTVAQLLTHHSGLMGNPDNDPLFAMIRKAASERKGASPMIQALLAEHLRRKLKRAPGAAYIYANAGYLALGAIIEDRSKRPYEDYCRDAVMKPLNISGARLHPDWRIWSSMGGWIISSTDYLALADVFAADNPFLGPKVKAWIEAMRGAGAMEDGDWYSLGVITHAGNGGWHVGHGGQLNSRGVDAKGKPTTAIIRATFARAPDGTALFAAFTPASYDNKALNDLRSALGRANQAWKSFK